MHVLPLLFVLCLTFLWTVTASEDTSSEKDLLFSLKKCNAELIYSEIRFQSFIEALPPFVKHANRIINDEKFVDLFLRTTDDKLFPAHRIIVAASSPVFSSLIYNETLLNMGGEPKNNQQHVNASLSSPSSSSSSSLPWPPQKNSTFQHTPSGPTVIQMDDDMNGKIVAAMLRYIYTGKVEKISELAGELIVAADRYGLTELKQLCERVILGQVKLENSIQMFKLGREVKSQKLRRKAFAVMKANTEASSSLPRGHNITMTKMSTDGIPIIAKIFYIKQQKQDYHKSKLFKSYYNHQP